MQAGRDVAPHLVFTGWGKSVQIRKPSRSRAATAPRPQVQPGARLSVYSQWAHIHRTHTRMHIKKYINGWPYRSPDPTVSLAAAGTPLVPLTASFSHRLTLRDSHTPLAQRQRHPLASRTCTATRLPARARSGCWFHRHGAPVTPGPTGAHVHSLSSRLFLPPRTSRASDPC